MLMYGGNVACCKLLYYFFLFVASIPPKYCNRMKAERKVLFHFFFVSIWRHVNENEQKNH